MRARGYRIWRETVVIYLGGLCYCGIELLWRGRTHGSMFLLGGLCFWLVGGLNRGGRLSVLLQMALGALIVTALELWTGLVVNNALGLRVWDYSDVPLNYRGQICLPFTLLWFCLCGAVIFAEDGLRHALFHEPVPQYKWI